MAAGTNAFHNLLAEIAALGEMHGTHLAGFLGQRTLVDSSP